MLKDFRWLVIALMPALSCLYSAATPIIVGRTAQGFLVGTNFTASDGSNICKLHYSHNKVLVIAGQPIKFGYITASSKMFHPLFNIEKEVATVSLSILSPERVMDSVRAIIENDILKHRRYVVGVPGLDHVTYSIVLVSEEIPQPPQIWIEDLSYSTTDGSFRSKPQHFTMSLGQIVEEVNRQGPIFKSYSEVNRETMEMELEGATQRHSQSSDPSYRPPYALLELSPRGVNFLTDTLTGLCTGSPPVY